MLISTNYHFFANSKDGTLPSLSSSSLLSSSTTSHSLKRGTNPHVNINTTAVSSLRCEIDERILPEGGGHDNGIKVHNQRDQPANWITVRCRLIRIVSSTEPDRTLQLHTTPTSLLLSRVHAYVCIAHVRTIHLRAFSFSFRWFTPTQDTPLYDPIARALFSLYGNVVRNTYVTPKLIRYNFTGRFRSSIYYLLLRRRVVGLLVGFSVLPLPRLPTSQRRYPFP